MIRLRPFLIGAIIGALLGFALGHVLAQPAPPQLTLYGVPGGTCAIATNADTITADPPGTPDGPLTRCWPAPPAWVEASGPGGTVRWERDAPPPTPTPQPEYPARQWLALINPPLSP